MAIKGEDNIEVSTVFYPENALESKRILGIKMRNLIEAAIGVVFVGYIIYLIPFVTRVKIIFMVIICGSVALFNIIGIKNQSLSEAFINWVTFRSKRAVYHYKDLRIQRKEKKVAKVTNALNESLAEKGIRIVKEKYQEYMENAKYR